MEFECQTFCVKVQENIVLMRPYPAIESQYEHIRQNDTERSSRVMAGSASIITARRWQTNEVVYKGGEPRSRGR
jgi:hypothetical protein